MDKNHTNSASTFGNSSGSKRPPLTNQLSPSSMKPVLRRRMMNPIDKFASQSSNYTRQVHTNSENVPPNLQINDSMYRPLSELDQNISPSFSRSSHAANHPLSELDKNIPSHVIRSHRIGDQNLLYSKQLTSVQNQSSGKQNGNQAGITQNNPITSTKGSPWTSRQLSNTSSGIIHQTPILNKQREPIKTQLPFNSYSGSMQHTPTTIKNNSPLTSHYASAILTGQISGNSVVTQSHGGNDSILTRFNTSGTISF